MFTQARIKLTAWYLCIIMLISVMFSVAIYRNLTSELERGFNRISQRYLQEYGPIPSQLRPEILEPSYLQSSEDRIKLELIYVNLFILVVSGIGGYILAGITLSPIKKMIDEQNRFITDASHELRTPITSLKSEIEVYLRGKNHNEKESKQLAKSNLEEVNNLQTLSDSLLELAQYQKSPSQQAFTSVSLLNIVEKAEKKLQNIAKQKNIMIYVKMVNLKVMGDEESLTQLFGILLDNAIKYSPQNTKVTINAVKIDGFVKITIKDEGMGITEKDIPQIFDRFYRADNSRTKQDVAGYGLGLSIAKKIIADHKGSIRVSSTLNKGTTFTLELPAFK